MRADAVWELSSRSWSWENWPPVLTFGARDDTFPGFFTNLKQEGFMERTGRTDIAVWTLFHGDQLRKQVCVRENGEGTVSLAGLTDGSRGLVSRNFSFDELTVDIPTAVLRHNHLLLFEGLIPHGGVSNGVRRCRIEGIGADDRYHYSSGLVSLSIPLSNAKEGALCDAWLEDSLFSWREDGEYAKQKLMFQMITIPKKTTRSLLLTFKVRSLAPWWRVVKSSEKELIVESANSY